MKFRLCNVRNRLLPPRARGITQVIFCLGLVSLFSGCSSWQTSKGTVISSVHDDEGSSMGKRGKYNRPYRVRGKTYHPLRSSKGYREVGLASWYGAESGNRTATGDRFDPHAMTAAHKTLPLPTHVRVTNLANGQSTILTVNDRGPFVPGRIIDLSYGAARRLNMHHRGTSRVLVEALN